MPPPALVSHIYCSLGLPLEAELYTLRGKLMETSGQIRVAQAADVEAITAALRAES